MFFHFFIQLFILEHGVQPLDGADVDAVHVAADIHGVIGQVADIVQFAEFTAVIRRLEVYKLIIGLLAQIVAIDQEQHAPRFGLADQAVDEINGRIRLTAGCVSFQ